MSWYNCAHTQTHVQLRGEKKNTCGCLFTRETEKNPKEFSKYIGTGGYLRHLTGSIIGTPDVIYEVSYKCGPYHAGGEGKEAKKNGKRKEDKKGVHPKGMKDKNDVYDYINQGEVL